MAQRGQITNWTQFKTNLVIDFPSSTDSSDVLVSLMERKKKADESYESFVYAMLALGRRGNFSTKSIIQFIISGLGDPALIENVAMAKCASIGELLELLNSLSKIRAQVKSRDKFDGSAKHKVSHQKTINGSRNNVWPPVQGHTRDVHCFKCKSLGHFARDCKKNFNQPKSSSQQVCFNCKELGHFARNCRATKRRPFAAIDGPPNKIRRLVNNQQNEGGLIKEIKVGDFKIKAFLDLGADCSTLKLVEANKYNVKRQHCHEVLNGFGGGTTSSTAKTHQTVTVGDVTMPIDIYIVEDNSQDVPMILGRNFLDSPRVRVVKEFGSLAIENVNPRK
ncbi:uncharacterized protein LOC129913311 [Episyrphus balteatus]|uniref:uncharacterized protein LOC129913311 n=1 Tax=Episyrphus balteatus TaxID=286459 RepID=UPI002485B78D|nr:uncharacterized protein LOC129913311 [Episyrphus balteatus]